MNIYTLKQHYRNTHPKEELPAFLKTDENEMSEVRKCSLDLFEIQCNDGLKIYNLFVQSDSHVDNSDDLDAYETSDDVETDTVRKKMYFKVP